ncbi:hypothetical protein LZQ00_07105 [Sphingobacterium sp. SRCM116780]|nr:hypothetical protein [Sphingobacterium sp. SRCM116780]UIR57580.1 hypothetical protein LZQ00_07105 [Sphingobacterium sp. SRCM116780]
MIPCSDHVQEVSMRTTASKQVHHEDENHMDYCSPFCVCSCCSTVMHVEDTTVLSFIVVLLQSKDEIAHESNFYSFDYSSIWQPPQLV